jgi:hypothetical protein
MRGKIAILMFVILTVVTIGRADDSAYAVSVVISGSVFTLDTSDGAFLVRKWDAQGHLFVRFPVSTGARVEGSIIDVSIGSAQSATVLISQSRNIYSLWSIAFQSGSAQRLWLGKLNDEVYTLRHAGNTTWILSGQREVYAIRGSDACRFVVSESPITFAAVKSNTIALGGELQTYSIPERDCRVGHALKSLIVRGYTQDVAPRAHGWIAIVHQTAGSRLVLVDDDLKPITAVPIAEGAPWRLVSSGDAVVASAPNSKLAYEIRGDRIAELTLTQSVNGYACPSLLAGLIYFTDGARVTTVDKTTDLFPRRVCLVNGILIYTKTAWLLFCLCAAAIAVLVRRRFGRDSFKRAYT